MAFADHVGGEYAEPEGFRAGRLGPSARRWSTTARREGDPAQFVNDTAPDAAAPILASELDCLRSILPPALLKAAEARSRQIGIGADQVLFHWGAIDERSYLLQLATHTGMTLDTLSDPDLFEGSLPDRYMLGAARHGILPLLRDGRLVWAVAPRISGARELSKSANPLIRTAERICLVPSSSFNQFLQERGGKALAQHAIDGLRRRFPIMSAAPESHPRRSLRVGHIVSVLVGGALLMLPISFTLDLCGGLLAAWFLAFIALRIIGSLMPLQQIASRTALPDDELPIYTVIAALHREATSVAPLVSAIEALDYPREKLQLILVIEPDDPETRAAIERLGSRPHLEMLVAPDSGPRTKPKALNYALPFARGSFIAVFDAEDRPEPNQLRAAIAAFHDHGTDLACVQASLCIENASDSWLSELFAAEYAGQFDVFLHGLVRLGLPLPLGGSSNHFRSDVLRQVGGWDPYNVTEDADLGFRLARFGYRSATFASTTLEEAPSQFGGWLPQRSRWMKGWMQTWGVHMRAPARLWREAGPRGFWTMNILIGGNVLTALAYPLLIAEVAIFLTLGTPGALFSGPLAPLHLATLVSGYLSVIGIGLLGLARRGRLRRGWFLALTPLYWACLSIAAWRALWQLMRDPYRWEKTEHGLSKQAGARPARRTPPAIDPAIADLLRRC